MKCVNGFRVMKERMVERMSDKMWKLGWLVVMLVGIGVGVQVVRVLEEVRLGEVVYEQWVVSAFEM